MSKRRYAVLGLGQLGRNMARELTRLGCEVLAVDRNAKAVDSIRDEVASAAVADIRDKEALRELFSSHFDGAVVAIGGSLEAAIMATLYLREMGIAEIWAEANADDRADVLQRVGATRIIAPERDMGRRLAQQLVNPNLVDFLPLTAGHGVVELEAPAWTHEKTLAELDLRKNMSLAVVAVHRSGGPVIIPGGQTKLTAGDRIVLVGKDSDLTRFRERT